MEKGSLRAIKIQVGAILIILYRKVFRRTLKSVVLGILRATQKVC